MGGDKQEEQGIRDLIQRLSWAFGDRDVEAVMSCYRRSDDLVVFDLAPPLELIGWETSRQKLRSFFAGLEPNPVVSWDELRIVVDNNHGFVSGHLNFVGKNSDGVELRQHCRSTLVFERGSRGEWLIIHEHDSVPADFNIPGYG